MAWLLKKRLAELEKKVKELDPEKVSQRLLVALEELSQFEKDTKQALEKAVEEKTKGLFEALDEKRKELNQHTARLNAIDIRINEQDKKIEKLQKDLGTISDQLAELTAKIKKFVSSTQETTKIALFRISEVIKETLELIEEKAEEPTKPDAAEPADKSEYDST